MPIPVSCPQCQARFAAPDNLAGKTVSCPSCQSAIEIPTAASKQASEQEQPQPTAKSKQPAEKSETDRRQGSDDSKAKVPPANDGGYDDDEDDDKEDQPVTLAGQGERAETEMDMTPMVDVTFLLLIFFMVTASFSLQKALQVPTPQESDQPSSQPQQVEDPPEEDPDFVIVHVDSFNTYQVTTPELEEEAASETELYNLLKQARAGANGVVPTKLIVRANIEALHEKVVSAIDAGALVGMEEVQLMTVEEDE